MAGHSSVMLGWNKIDLSVLRSQLFGQASAESCALLSVVVRVLRTLYPLCQQLPVFA